MTHSSRPAAAEPASVRPSTELIRAAIAALGFNPSNRVGLQDDGVRGALDRIFADPNTGLSPMVLHIIEPRAVTLFRDNGEPLSTWNPRDLLVYRSGPQSIEFRDDKNELLFAISGSPRLSHFTTWTDQITIHAQANREPNIQVYLDFKEVICGYGHYFRAKAEPPTS